LANPKHELNKLEAKKLEDERILARELGLNCNNCYQMGSKLDCGHVFCDECKKYACIETLGCGHCSSKRKTFSQN